MVFDTHSLKELSKQEAVSLLKHTRLFPGIQMCKVLASMQGTGCPSCLSQRKRLMEIGEVCNRGSTVKKTSASKPGMKLRVFLFP